jgi:hypothetical protein
MKNLLELLPLSLFPIIREYLLDWSLTKGKLRNDLFISWRNFLNCCSCSFMKEIKEHLIYYNLNDEYSRFYLQYPLSEGKEPTLGQMISPLEAISRIKNSISASKFQVSLKFVYHAEEKITFNDNFIEKYSNVFTSIHGLMLPGLTEFTDSSLKHFENLFLLSLRYCGAITNAYPLRNIKIQDLSGCYILDHHGALENCLEVNLTLNTIKGIENLVKLRKIKKLILSSCYYGSSSFPEIEDPAQMEEPPILDISLPFECRYLAFSLRFRVSNLSIFRNVYELSLRGCQYIKDLSAFDHVIILEIRGISGISSPLPQKNCLKSLSLDGNQLQNVGIELFPENQKKFIQINIYSDLPTSFISLHTGLSVLQDVYNVAFHYLLTPGLTIPVENIRSVRNLSFYSCSSIIINHDLPFLIHLLISESSHVLEIDYSLLPSLQELQLDRIINELFRFEINSLSLKRLILNKCHIEELVLHCNGTLEVLGGICSPLKAPFLIHLLGNETDVKLVKIDPALRPCIDQSNFSNIGTIAEDG